MSDQSGTPSVVQLYNKLSDTVPPIFYSELWEMWLFKGDIAPEEFETPEEYMEEFPYQCTVSESSSRVVINEIGTGGGETSWFFQVLPSSHGSIRALLIERTNGPEEVETIIKAFDLSNEAEDLTADIIPEIHQNMFFSRPFEVLNDYPLTSLIWAVSDDSLSICVTAQKNYPWICIDGKIGVSDIPEEKVTEICNAWNSFEEKSINLFFDTDTFTFKVS